MPESPSDATLLERFVSRREEAAFVALVRRHGLRVERICRRILRNEHDVEDVFQATFLVLARKAAGGLWHESVGPWLDQVARRLALQARSGAARQNGRELTVTALIGGSAGREGRLPERYHPWIEPSAEVERRDLRRVLDDELLQLPEKYRAPIVLCDLEGRTREEAARQLGWPAGSMSRRLDRGRTLLRRRLTHRGVALTIIGLASIAVAAAAIGVRTDLSRRESPVRQAMASFRPETEGGLGYGPILASAARNEGPEPDFARILPAAREAASVAGRLEQREPAGPLATFWRQLARDMKSSALDLERACRESNALAVLAAARRLDASCLDCHAVFHRGSSHAAFSASDRRSSWSFFPDISDWPATMNGAATVREQEALPSRVNRSCTLAARPGEDRWPTLAGPPPIPSISSNEWEVASVKRDESLHSETAWDRWGISGRVGGAHFRMRLVGVRFPPRALARPIVTLIS
jgi:RNA polymerase sigma-70 factor (ECF subfamily)